MRAARTVQPVPFTVPPARPDLDALAVLREMVAALGERVEVLETREQIARARFTRPQAGSVRGRE